MPPKKVISPGITVIMIDGGVNMARKDEENGKTDYEKAISAADWIVSRKLFSEDPEKFIVMAYNLNPADHTTDFDFDDLEGIAIQDQKFVAANFDHLKFITQEIGMNNQSDEPNFPIAIKTACRLLEEENEKTNASAVTLILLTNGMSDYLRKQEELDLTEECVTKSGADLMVIGIPENPEFPASRYVQLADAVEGRTYSFENVAKMLSNYQARQKAERKNNKLWDIAPGIRLPLVIALKSEKASALLKFKNTDSTGNDMVRFEQMHVETQNPEDVKNPQTSEDVKQEEKEDFSITVNAKKYKPVADVKMMHGYNFGKSLILMDPEYMKEKYNDHNFNEGQTGGVLKLIQFTKRANILESYLLDASAKTVLPAINSFTKATVSLIEAMLELRVAAICRFAFHAKSHVQLVALLPHRDEETGVAYLRSVKLPYSDDMRTLKFPKFSLEEDEEDGSKPSLAQLSAVDDLIDNMQLKEGEIANLVEGGMSDPKLQMQCHFLKSFVLNPDDTLEAHATRTNQILNNIMAPKRRVETENPEIFDKLGREFNLQPIQKTKRQRVEVEAADLQNMINEWTEKRKKTSDEEKGEKKAKKPKKASRREEVQAMCENGEAAEICKETLKMIGNTCGFQNNGGFFALLLAELKIIREVFVEKEQCTEFNELLKKLKEEEDFEPFAEFIAEDKACNPISTSEVKTSEVSDDDAAEFWEEM